MGEIEERPDYSGVGRQLKAARQAVGQQIRDVAQALRISALQLEAIEAGRYEELPSAVYVHGFVRSYAGYLQLDADEMVRRVRLEYTPEELPDELHFPAAPQDSPRPSRRMLLLAMALAVIVFGIWQLNLRFGTAPAPQPEGPTSGLQSRQAPAAALAPETPAANGPASAAPDEAPGAEAPLIPPVEELVEESTQARSAAAAPEAAQEPQTPPAAAILAENIGQVEISPGDVAAYEELPEIPDGLAAFAPSRPPGAQPAPGPEPEPVSAAVTQPEAQPEALQNAPVVLRASSDTWMQVSYANGAVMKSWVMRAGEQYVPPADETGLLLMIGNAGALTVFIEGQPMPALGEKGAVIRALPLDAASLKARFGG